MEIVDKRNINIMKKNIPVTLLQKNQADFPQQNVLLEVLSQQYEKMVIALRRDNGKMLNENQKINYGENQVGQYVLLDPTKMICAPCLN